MTRNLETIIRISLDRVSTPIKVSVTYIQTKYCNLKEARPRQSQFRFLSRRNRMLSEEATLSDFEEEWSADQACEKPKSHQIACRG